MGRRLADLEESARKKRLEDKIRATIWRGCKSDGQQEGDVRAEVFIGNPACLSEIKDPLVWSSKLEAYRRTDFCDEVL